MRVVLQRVTRASVAVDGEEVSSIEQGYLLLVGVARDDDEADTEQLAAKIVGLRIFRDADGKTNEDLAAVGGAALVVSQFTLLGDTARGNRPSFTDAAAPEVAEPLYERVCGDLRELGLPVATGVFGARMEVELVNDGPVTILLEV